MVDQGITFKRREDGTYIVLLNGQEIGGIQSAQDVAKGWRFAV